MMNACIKFLILLFYLFFNDLLFNAYLILFYCFYIRDNKDASISEIHDFVKKIPQLTKDYKSLNQVCICVSLYTHSNKFQ